MIKTKEDSLKFTLSWVKYLLDLHSQNAECKNRKVESRAEYNGYDPKEGEEVRYVVMSYLEDWKYLAYVVSNIICESEEIETICTVTYNKDILKDLKILAERIHKFSSLLVKENEDPIEKNAPSENLIWVIRHEMEAESYQFEKALNLFFKIDGIMDYVKPEFRTLGNFTAETYYTGEDRKPDLVY